MSAPPGLRPQTDDPLGTESGTGGRLFSWAWNSIGPGLPRPVGQGTDQLKTDRTNTPSHLPVRVRTMGPSCRPDLATRLVVPGGRVSLVEKAAEPMRKPPLGTNTCDVLQTGPSKSDSFPASKSLRADNSHTDKTHDRENGPVPFCRVPRRKKLLPFPTGRCTLRDRGLCSVPSVRNSLLRKRGRHVCH